MKGLFKHVVMAALLVGGAVGLIPRQAYAGLIGASVHGTYRFDNFQTIFQDGGTQTIAAGTVFDLSTQGGVTVTFSDTQITITNLTPGQFFPSAFNGPDLAFLSGAAITNVTVDAASSQLFVVGSVLDFSADDIHVNLSGTCGNCTGGEKIILDVTTASTVVPEPASLTLLSSALLGFGIIRRPRKHGTR